jgi:putative FmdB family regulatory protein
MPKYDYRCNDCGHVYEKREGFDAPSVQACPQCAGTARRVLTPPAIVFKGSGWYVTDHRKGGDSESSPSSSSSSGKSETTSKSSETPKSEAASGN